MGNWIDLQREIRGLAYGDRKGIAQGGWGILRIMRLGERSIYWDEDRQEAFGGPPWNYDDRLVRYITKPGYTASSSSAGRKGEAPIADVGLDLTGGSVMGIVPHPDYPLTRDPLEHDLFYEIEEHASVLAPAPPLHIRHRYRILRVIPDYGDYGRVELFLLICQRVHGET